MKNLFENIKISKNGEIKDLTQELTVLYCVHLLKTYKKNILVVTNSLYEATNYYNDIKLHNNALLFPQDDNASLLNYKESPELKYTRLETLNESGKNNHVVVTNMSGFLKKLPNVKNNNKIELSIKTKISRTKIIDSLINLGYKKEVITSNTGEFSTRGLVLDIFPIYENHPVRIEFDDDEIINIKYYNEIDQKSTRNIKNIQINSVNETVENSSLVEYLNNPLIIYLNKEKLLQTNELLITDNNCFHSIDKFSDIKNLSVSINKENEIINYNENFELLKRDYNKFKNSHEIYFYLTNTNIIKKINNLIKDPNIVNKKLNKGFMFNNKVFITENDIKTSTTHEINYSSKYKFGYKIKNYNDINLNDFVVHINHGVGIYKGLTSIPHDNVLKDYLLIEYKGSDKIYIPVENINNIYKYGDEDGSKPIINSLNSNNWLKTTKRVQEKIEDITDDLIELYEERLIIKNKPYIVNYPEEEVFASEVDFILTKDQIKSINDMKRDLSKDYPMDRLLIGDVGFGKTEVANRAMFTTVLNKEQVMYLCPTTILSMQQYEKSLDRFKNHGINIALINRFVSKKKQLEIIKDFKIGKIDILFGTHRLLSKDIKPQSLGLLVVDEEQRFGVTHKEKIKQIKTNVNVLTLSATPIPRTLQMSLSGLRDLSLIETPPLNRYPIQTYVLEEEEEVVKNAIYKELSRKGQTFILYNNIEKLDALLKKINQLVPEANIVYAHGRMNKLSIENIMTSFTKGEIDVLISTTIIENGIDIPNANTLIIYDSNNFGLSQLYQIRGRIGRSDRFAYAYLFYKKNKVLTEEAYKRLKSIEEFTELGSGYDIALRDLSIRGSGDVFGKNQSGFIDKVGMNFYMKLMQDRVSELKGELIEPEEEIKSSYNVSTHIRDDYIPDEELKIYVHELINKINTKEKFNEVLFELEDRFGKVNEEIKTYMYKSWFDKLTNKYNLRVENNNTIIINSLNTYITEEAEYDIKLRRSQTIIMKKPNVSDKDFLKKVINTLTIIKNNQNI